MISYQSLLLSTIMLNDIVTFLASGYIVRSLCKLHALMSLIGHSYESGADPEGSII